MRPRSRFLIVAGSVAALGWGYAHVREDQRRAQREIDRLGAELAQVQAPPGRVAAARVLSSGATLGRAAQVARAEARAVLAEQGGSAAGTEPAPPPITFEESQQRVAAAFAEEAVDASWGPDAERTLERIVRAHLPAGSRLEHLACRASMCEVKLAHADPTAQGDFLRTGFQGWPGSLFVAEERQERGEVAVTIIAAREGTEPPIAPR